jgi:hypothetical protein
MDTDFTYMNEAQWQSVVIREAMLAKWAYYHPPDNIPYKGNKKQNIVAGFPDLTLVRGDRLVFVELKAEKGRITEAQKVWLKRLEATGVECYLWRPSDYDTMLKTLE